MKRVAIISGVRTPFVKAGTVFTDYSFQDMGAHVLKALVTRTNISPEIIDELFFGTVLLDPRTPNWAREILFQAQLPKKIVAHSVSNNCVSGLLAITTASDRIALGLSNCAIAGGSESMSNPPLMFSKTKSRIFMELNRAKTIPDKLKIILKNPFQVFPNSPGITEPSTGLTMGEHMEITAKELEISRELQDEIAANSHKNAASAQANRLSLEIEPFGTVKEDNIIRRDSSIQKLSKLKPVFDRSSRGTITAGNSSPLTDGASAVLLMSEERAKQEKLEPLAFISSYEYAAIDPNDGLLMAPAVAVPRLLKRVGLSANDIDLFEIHEAFAAQVAANIKAWEEGLKEPALSKIDRSKINIHGGSIAIGHPFAATGGRLVTTLANELKARNLKRGLISICAAGAMAGALILER